MRMCVSVFAYMCVCVSGCILTSLKLPLARALCWQINYATGQTMRPR